MLKLQLLELSFWVMRAAGLRKGYTTLGRMFPGLFKLRRLYEAQTFYAFRLKSVSGNQAPFWSGDHEPRRLPRPYRPRHLARAPRPLPLRSQRPPSRSVAARPSARHGKFHRRATPPRPADFRNRSWSDTSRDLGSVPALSLGEED